MSLNGFRLLRRPTWGKEKPPYKGSFLHGGLFISQQGHTARKEQNGFYQIKRSRAIHYS